MKTCYDLSPKLRVAIAYIAVTNGGMIDAYAPRFARSYQEFPGEYPHSLTILCNGGPLAPRRKAFFDGVECEFVPRENDGGYDISAYQNFAAATDADFIVCFGESVYFHRAGWLDRLVKARLQNGPGMYGVFSSHAVRAHLNTTAFACDRQYLEKYPKVLNYGARYEFEHGEGAMWRRIVAGGGAAMLVTFDGAYPTGQWRQPDNILWRGTQLNCLALCNHSSRWEGANPNTRAAWSRDIDQAFK